MAFLRFGHGRNARRKAGWRRKRSIKIADWRSALILESQWLPWAPAIDTRPAALTRLVPYTGRCLEDQAYGVAWHTGLCSLVARSAPTPSVAEFQAAEGDCPCPGDCSTPAEVDELLDERMMMLLRKTFSERASAPNLRAVTIDSRDGPQP
jgi:hypothetical protein